MSSEDVRTHSALHVLKGAVQIVLGARWTASVYVSGTHGRLTVQFDRKPTDTELLKIEHAANQRISEGVQLIEFEMDREEAERNFGDQIYDLFPLPSTITKLKLVRIPDWNVNCCVKKHVENTVHIGSLKLGRVRFRGAKRLLELEFDLA